MIVGVGRGSWGGRVCLEEMAFLEAFLRVEGLWISGRLDQPVSQIMNF